MSLDRKIEQLEFMAQCRVTRLGQGLDEVFDHRAQAACHLNTFRTVVPYLSAGKMQRSLPNSAFGKSSAIVQRHR